MSGLIYPSEEIGSLMFSLMEYVANYGKMHPEYTGVMCDLYNRSHHSSEVAISYYEESILMKVKYLINKRLSK